MLLFLLMFVYLFMYGCEVGWLLWMIVCGVGVLLMFGVLLVVEVCWFVCGYDLLFDVCLFCNLVVVFGLLFVFLFYMLSVFFLSYGIYL